MVRLRHRASHDYPRGGAADLGISLGFLIIDELVVYLERRRDAYRFSRLGSGVQRAASPAIAEVDDVAYAGGGLLDAGVVDFVAASLAIA